MQAHTLELFNFCKHRERIVEFQPGLTAIIGPNGVGKSDTLGGMLFGLVGKVHKPGILTSNICDLAPETENSFVRLTFSHGGVVARVTRNLRPKTPTATLELSNGETLQGAEKVNERILQILGVTEEIINDIVIVRQDDLFGFLDRQPSKRKEAFQRLFGLQRAETIYDDCTQALGQIEIPTVTVDMDELRINVRQKEQQVRTLSSELSTVPDDEAIKAGTAENQAVIDCVATTSRLMAEIAAESTKLRAAEDAGTLANGSLRTARQHEATIVAAMNANAEAASEADRIISNLGLWRSNNRARRQTAEQLAAAEARLAAMVPPSVPDGYVADAQQRQLINARRDGLQSEIATLDYHVKRGNEVVRPPHPGEKPANYVYDRDAHTKELNDLDAIIGSYERLLRSVAGGKACCDGCGTPVTTLQQKIADAEANMPRCTTRYNELIAAREATDRYDMSLDHHERNMEIVRHGEESARLKQPLVEELQRIDAGVAVCVAFDREYHAYLASHQAATETVTNLRATLANLPPEIDLTSYDEATLQRTSATQKTYAEGLAEIRQEISLKEAEVGRHEGTIQTLKDRIKDLQTQLAAVPLYTHDQKEVAQKNVEWWNSAKTRRATLVAQLQAAQETLADVQTRLAENEAVIARSQRMREWKAHLEAIRGGFHKDAAPRVCALRQLQNLEAVVNEHLAMMQADFRVTPSDDLSFIGRFHNGSTQPASRLSGGQRVLLVFAVRLALSAMYAGTLGLLCLDEPTAYLDEHHIRGFEPAMEKLKEYAATTGLQCVIVTHERSLAPLFDNVINLAI